MTCVEEMPNKVLVIFAHPALHRSQINKRMLAAIRHLDGVTVNNLYENYPDFFIDIKHEQALLRDADLIVFNHPLYWYSAPSIIKEWQDVVLQRGFAYGRGGTALRGKDFMLAISTGGNEQAYTPQGAHQHTLEALLLPFAQTAALCGMHYHPPFVIQGSFDRSHEDFNQHARAYARLLSNYVESGRAALNRNTDINQNGE